MISIMALLLVLISMKMEELYDNEFEYIELIVIL